MDLFFTPISSVTTSRLIIGTPEFIKPDIRSPSRCRIARCPPLKGLTINKLLKRSNDHFLH